jgi:hypothetical protein
MRALRSVLGYGIMFTAAPLGRAVLRLTNDIGLRIVLLPMIFALAGAGLALVWFNRREPSD